MERTFSKLQEFSSIGWVLVIIRHGECMHRLAAMMKDQIMEQAPWVVAEDKLLQEAAVVTTGAVLDMFSAASNRLLGVRE
mmetsp:Transcript_5560/g.10171  ORF Transcript_5560/g.10171 Transcript_5560/m.10171 type:complete len:80 (-) Transcript_5560:175-414(-)